MITNNQHDYGILIIQLENPVNTNLTGLLANQIMAEYFLPTLILNKRIDDETGAITWEGSGRGFAIDGIEDWRAYIEPYAMYAEGHSMAFGVGFTPEQLKIFQEHMIKAKSLMAFDKAYNVDYIFSMNDSFDAIIKEIASYEDIWGKGVAQPYVAIKDITLKKRDILL
jgi:single-stranded DNA-specific DHH superfamily exonuclease